MSFFAQESLDNPCLIISVCALYFNFSNISSYSQSPIIIQSTLTKIFWKPLSPQGSKAMSIPLSSTCISHLILYLRSCFFTYLSCAIQWYGQHEAPDKNYLWRLSSQTLSFWWMWNTMKTKKRPSKPIMVIYILPSFLGIATYCLTGFMESDTHCVSCQKTRYFFIESSWLKTVNKTWSM